MSDRDTGAGFRAEPKNYSPRKLIGLKIATLVAEVGLLLLVPFGLETELLYLAHIFLCALLFIALVSDTSISDWGKGDPFPLYLMLGGPVGAAIALWESGAQARPEEGLQEWYDTMAPLPDPEAFSIVDTIRDNRCVRPRARLPRQYRMLLRRGNLEQKQSLLAYLAGHLELPGVRQAIVHASRDHDVRIRVQAAAVAARLKSRPVPTPVRFTELAG